MIAMPLDILRQKYLDATDVKDILFYGYLYQQKKCFGLDYNDLINFTLYIFEISEEIRLKWAKQYYRVFEPRPDAPSEQGGQAE